MKDPETSPTELKHICKHNCGKYPKYGWDEWDWTLLRAVANMSRKLMINPLKRKTIKDEEDEKKLDKKRKTNEGV